MLEEYNFSKARRNTMNDNKVTVGESTSATSTTTSYWTNPYYNSEKGWECPRCGRINAPWVRQCDCRRENWSITWDYKEPWWKEVTCDSDTFKVHPETTTWKAPSSVCGSDSATVAKANPNEKIEVWSNSTDSLGGSDYWNEEKKCYTNGPTACANSCTSTSLDNPWNQFSTLTNQIDKLKYEIEELKETK